MNLCVIPARGGSKRIPRKNIRDFCGKPIIARSIDAAKASGCFDQIIVSTDDAEIADVARHSGAEVPFVRPANLSDDFSGTTPVVAHAVPWYQDQGQQLNAVCCLYATAPFVLPSDLRNGLELLHQAKSESFVFTATAYPSPIERALKVNTLSGEVEMISPEHFSTRSQDLEIAYHDAGQFYWGRSKSWLESSDIFSLSRLLVLPSWRVQDIDYEEDWLRAELLFQLCDKIASEPS